MNELIGRTIQKIMLADDSESIVFETDKGPLAYCCSGDCCSHTWIESVTGVEDAIGKVVTKVEKRETRELSQAERGDAECVQVYGYLIETGGTVPLLIDFRNESNGYYGGSLYQNEAIPTNTKELVADKN